MAGTESVNDVLAQQLYTPATSMGQDPVRQAFYDPTRRSPEEVVRLDAAARQLKVTRDDAHAMGKDATDEAAIQEASKNQAAVDWTAQDANNLSLLLADKEAAAEISNAILTAQFNSAQAAERKAAPKAAPAAVDVNEIGNTPWGEAYALRDEETAGRAVPAGSGRLGEALSNSWDMGRLQAGLSDLGYKFADAARRGASPEEMENLRDQIRAVQKGIGILDPGSELLALDTLITQFPRMLGRDVPTIASWAGQGALGGGVIGSFLPGAGTVAGMGAGFTAGAIGGIVKSSSIMEKGAMLADLALMKDDADQYLDPRHMDYYASGYGMFAGVVEAFADIISATGLGTAVAPFLRMGSKALSGAAKAQMRQSIAKPLKQGVLAFGKMAAGQGLEEGLQEAGQVVSETLLQNEAGAKGWNYYARPQDIFTKENIERVLDASWGGIQMGLWGGVLPFVGGTYVATAQALQARQFAEANKNIADKIAKSTSIRLSPERMETYLQVNGMTGDVMLPADAVQELDEKGLGIAQALGFEADTLREAAACGEDIRMPLARLHSVLSRDQMTALADVMREAPDVPNAMEATQLNQYLPADMDESSQNMSDGEKELSDAYSEVGRLTRQLEASIRELPKLQRQIGQEGDRLGYGNAFGKYVRDQIGMAARMARYTSQRSSGSQTVGGLLKRMSVVNGKIMMPGEDASIALGQAMYRSGETSLSDFFEKARAAERPGRSYFSWRGEGPFEGWEIRLPETVVRHINRRHPEVTKEDAAVLGEVLNNIDDAVFTRRQQNYGEAVLVRATVNGQGYGAILEANAKGQAYVTTFFKGDAPALKGWIEGYKRSRKGNAQKVTTANGEEKEASKVLAEADESSRLNPSVPLGRPVAEEIREYLAAVKQGAEGAKPAQETPGEEMNQSLSRPDASGPQATDPVAVAPNLYQVQNVDAWMQRLAAWKKAAVAGLPEEQRKKEEAAIDRWAESVAGAHGKLQEYLDKRDGGLFGKIANAVVGAKQALKKAKSGGITYSGPVRSNIDRIYLISFDASSMCVKRLSAANTARLLEQRLGRPLNVDDQMLLIALYQEKGKAAPCLYCYVESNRRRANQAVGEGLEVVFGEKAVPESWGKDRKEAASEAIEEAQRLGVRKEDIHFEYLTDPKESLTDEAANERRKYKKIYDYLTFEAAATKQNKQKPYEEYEGQLLDLRPEDVELLNGYAGIRFFSTSDFQIEHVVDLIQAFYDMNAMGAKSHSYTKVEMYVDIFGGTGQKINQSCFARGVDKHGSTDPAKWTLVADTAQGWDHSRAKANRKKYKDVGICLVASSDDILLAALHDPEIDYIIPFHYSGLERKYYGTLGYQDFTSTQNESLIYKSDAPTRVSPSEVDEMKRMPVEEASRRYLQKCFEMQSYPIKLDQVFADIAGDKSLSESKKQRLGKARWEEIVTGGGELDPATLNPNYFAERLKAGASTHDKAMFPEEANKIRMHEMGTVEGVSDEQGTRNYLQLCLERKLYPVFPAFMFKGFTPADPTQDTLWTKYDQAVREKRPESGKKTWAQKRDERAAKLRKDQTDAAKARWKAMVEAGKIDWDQIEPRFFKLKKDYARTDTSFDVVDPDKINHDAALKPLRETLDQGLENVYAADTEIADEMESILKGVEGTNINYGVKALEAFRAKKGVADTIFGRDSGRQGAGLAKMSQERAVPLEQALGGRQEQEGQALFQAAPATKTSAFKKWFGKSKAVDETGQPLVLYHGSSAENVDDDFAFDPRRMGRNGLAMGPGFYLTTDRGTAEDYARDGGSLIQGYASIQKPMPVDQKAFSRAVTRRIMRRLAQIEVEESGGEMPDARDGYLSNFGDTRSDGVDRVLEDAVDMVVSGNDKALDVLGELANVCGSRELAMRAVRDVTGYDGVVSNGWSNKGESGGTIYVAWFPEQIKATGNRGTFDRNDDRIFYQTAAAEPEMSGEALYQAAPDLYQMAVDHLYDLLQVAWHGSPHEIVGGLSLSKVGTGEGHQIHGWGLYFAQSRDISERRYRDLLAAQKMTSRRGQKPSITRNGNPVEGQEAERIASLWRRRDRLQWELDSARQSLDLLARGKVRLADGDYEGYGRRLREKVARTESEIDSIKRSLEGVSVGTLLEVDIPENDVLLDEGMTFSHQPEEVKRRLLDVFKNFHVEVPHKYGMPYVEGSPKTVTLTPDEARMFVLGMTKTERAQVRAALEKERLAENAIRDEVEAALGPNPWEALRETMPDLTPATLAKYLASDNVSAEDKGKLRVLRDARAKIDGIRTRKAGLNLVELSNREHGGGRSNRDGKRIREALQDLLKRAGDPTPERSASLTLNRAGIPGLTYEGGIDGRCFVIWDETAIQIIERYNQALARQASPDEMIAGGIRTLSDGRRQIELMGGANLSTITHEMAHFFFLEMQEMVRQGLADDRLIADMKALNEWTGQLNDDAKLKEEYDLYQRYARSEFGGRPFEDLTPEEKEKARAVARQEWLARGFEQYLREGKAPGKKLQSLFDRFKKWMIAVYRQALELHVELTDEVRDVFDRIVATEGEMDEAAGRSQIRDETRRVLDALGVTGAERLALESLVSMARSRGADTTRRLRDRNRRQLLKMWTEEASDQAKKEPLQKTRAALRGEALDIASVQEAVGEEATKALMRKLPGAAKKEGGVDAGVKAQELGYGSAEEMIRDVLNGPSLGERIREIVREKQAAHDAEIDILDALYEQPELGEQQARIADLLEKKIRSRISEAGYRGEVAGDTLRGEDVAVPEETKARYRGSEALARYHVAREQLTDRANAVLDRKTMREATRPGAYRTASARWLKEERRAILAGDYDRALECNYKARLNLELARQAAKRRDMMDSLADRAKRRCNSDSASINGRYAIYRLARRIGLFDPSEKMLRNAVDKDAENAKAFVSEMVAEGQLADDSIDTDLFVDGDGFDWREKQWAVVRPYAEAIAKLLRAELDSRTILVKGKREDLKTFAEGLAKNIEDHANKRSKGDDPFARVNAITKALRTVHAEHLTADTIALLLDGDVIGGPAWNAIIKPINDATWNRADRLAKAKKKLEEIFFVYSRRELGEMQRKKTLLPNVPHAFTKEQALCILLNLGNEGNRQRLLDGLGYTEEQVQAIVDTLDKRDVQFCQNVWDWFETYRVESFDLEEEMTGARPQRVEATPVHTRHGDLRGGYYPAVYDPQRTTYTAPPGEVQAGRQTRAMHASVAHGSMKARSEGGLYGAPLRLSLRVIPEHAVQTCHMLAFRKPIANVAKILRQKPINNAIQKSMGVEVGRALDSWLKYVAGERPQQNRMLSAFASWVRMKAAFASMALKLTTMLAQVCGLLFSVPEIGARWCLVGVKDMFAGGNPIGVYRTVIAKSGFMRHRMDALDREIFESSTDLIDIGSGNRATEPFRRFQRLIQKKGFLPMAYVQMFCADLPTWLGAYKKRLAETKSEDEAIHYADATVTRTQGGGSEKDLASIQRGRELSKLMTMYYTVFGALYNLSARRITMLDRNRDAASLMRLGTLMLLAWFGEPVLTGMLQGKGPDGDDPEPEDWALWAAREAMFNPWQMVVGVRDLSNMIESNTEGRQSDMTLGSSLNIFRVLWQAAYSDYKVATGEGEPKQAALRTTKAVGQVSGVIPTQAVLALEAFWDWLDGTSPEFEASRLLRKKK